MSKLVIKKRISLDFLGEDYKDAYLVFQCIPVSEYDSLLTKINSVEGDGMKANQTIIEILKDKYIEGKFPNDDGKLEDLDSKDELNGLTGEAVISCFTRLTGQEIKPDSEGAVQIDPKSATELQPGSTTENLPPTK